MTPTDIGLFQLAERRLAWVDQRQRLLAQNVANASTPGFRPRDMAPFEAALGGAALAQTSPQHLPRGSAHPGQPARPTARSPDGNAVSLEEQLGRVADTAGMQELVGNLFHKYQGMFRLALGRGG